MVRRSKAWPALEGPDRKRELDGLESDLQVRNIAEVTTAVANGDLSLGDHRRGRGGRHLQLKNTINTMVDQLNSFASEVTRVAREVGTEGKLGGQAAVPGVAGVRGPDRQRHLDGVESHRPGPQHRRGGHGRRQGGLSRKITVEVKGEILQLKKTMNTMVERLSFGLGGDPRRPRGRHRGQARRPGGRQGRCWGLGRPDQTTSIRWPPTLPARCAGSLRRRSAVAKGDLSRKITVDVRGEILQLKETINTMVEQLRSFASEVSGVAREVGTEGRLGVQAVVPGVAGTWKDLTDSVNTMGSNLYPAGPQHRRSDNGCGARRPQPQDHCGREGRNPGAQEYDQYHGRSAQRLRLGTRSRAAWGAKSAPRVSWEARLRFLAMVAHGKT